MSIDHISFSPLLAGFNLLAQSPPSGHISVNGCREEYGGTENGIVYLLAGLPDEHRVAPGLDLHGGLPPRICWPHPPPKAKVM